jgi:hypothetical protein
MRSLSLLLSLDAATFPTALAVSFLCESVPPMCQHLAKHRSLTLSLSVSLSQSPLLPPPLPLLLRVLPSHKSHAHPPPSRDDYHAHLGPDIMSHTIGEERCLRSRATSNV